MHVISEAGLVGPSLGHGPGTADEPAIALIAGGATTFYTVSRPTATNNVTGDVLRLRRLSIT